MTATAHGAGCLGRIRVSGGVTSTPPTLNSKVYHQSFCTGLRCRPRRASARRRPPPCPVQKSLAEYLSFSVGEVLDTPGSLGQPYDSQARAVSTL